MTISTDLKKTPLYQEHLTLKAKMVPFGGWDMPVQYEGILLEHEATRKRAALFDISHMGEFMIEGDCQKIGLEKLLTIRLSDMPVKTCRYGLLLNERGGVMDDLIVFRIAQEQWFIVVNASTTEKDANQFRKNLSPASCFKDVSAQVGKLDLQGPLSREVLSRYVPEIGRLKFYTFDYFDLLGERVIISRTGYTGELGYEIYYPWHKTPLLWRELLTNPEVLPAGLGARDVLRLEVGYSLYGHELEEDISPLESGLQRFINFDKEFIGKDALLKQQRQGVCKKLVGVVSENRRAPRQGHKIFAHDGDVIGVVTSGTFSPCVNLGIGLGFVSSPHGQLKEKIYFGDEKGKNLAIISGKSFYQGGSLKS
jgi:aminomethyltransferase